MRWPIDLKEAKKIQLRLSRKIRIIPLAKKPAFIAGVDAAFSENKVVAAACLYKYPELIPVEDAYAAAKISFPYIPGFLSFREGDAIIKAIEKLKTKPDLILFDGQGIAHPGGTGIASHIGAILNVPTIGCAKSRLIGDYADPGNKKGRYSSLKYKNKTVGAVLRTRENVKPVFVSPGHLIDLRGAIYYVIKCAVKFRLRNMSMTLRHPLSAFSVFHPHSLAATSAY
ncbi:MAG: endonuclease V [Nitrospirae bacterium]|nr:endonuclease V [Nitrospirota bacterium]